MQAGSLPRLTATLGPTKHSSTHTGSLPFVRVLQTELDSRLASLIVLLYLLRLDTKHGQYLLGGFNHSKAGFPCCYKLKDESVYSDPLFDIVR